MVDRKFNKSIGKIGPYPLFWMSSVGGDWPCRCCSEIQKKGQVCFEFLVCRKAQSYQESMSKVLSVIAGNFLGGVPMSPTGTTPKKITAANQLYNNQLYNNQLYNKMSSYPEKSAEKPKPEYEYKKMFVCLKCSKELLTEAVQSIDVVQKYGPKGFELLDQT